MKEYMFYLYELAEILIDPSDYLHCVPSIKKILKDDVSRKDISRLIKNVSLKTVTGYRDRMIIELMYGTGLRLGEIHRLNIEDILFDEGIIFVKGKGNKKRMVPVGPKTLKFLKNYIDKYRPLLLQITNLNERALVIGSWKGGRLFINSVGRIIRKYAMLAGLDKITAHKLRHAFALHMMRNGCSLMIIREILGHVNLSTTTIYTEVYDSDLIEKIKKYHPGELIY
jgi:site-specific recombinase XerD